MRATVEWMMETRDSIDNGMVRVALSIPKEFVDDTRMRPGDAFDLCLPPTPKIRADIRRAKRKRVKR